jgi:16S rRNA processing protein RimM
MSSPPTSRIDTDAVVIVGKLGRPYGVHGWQVLHSFTERSENLFSYAPWFVQSAAGQPWFAVKGYESRPHKEAYVVQLDGVLDREEAQRLTGALIGVPRTAIPEPEDDEFFWHDLIGCAVINIHDEYLGEVQELMETGAHAILCIRSENAKRDVLVPFTQDYVLSVDTESRQVRVNWSPDWS